MLDVRRRRRRGIDEGRRKLMAVRKNDPVLNSQSARAGSEPRVLDGRFELRELLGSGGMATVYRGWDRERHRPCAVKVLAENLARDEEFRQRFRQEAEAASALVHPRIVRVYGYGNADSTPYITMEFVEGGTLRSLMDRRERLPEGLALRLAAEVADALAYAHSRRVVHRDIKPHNILLTSDEHVKVADFGIARSLDSTSHTRTGTVLGSTQYISPEQAAGQQAVRASDQYSLGVVLYEMLAGRLPFEPAETAVATALKHIHEPPFDLQWLRPDLSDATVTHVRRLLAKSPDARYANTADLAASLRRIYARLGHDASKTVVLPIRAGGEPRPSVPGVPGPVRTGGLAEAIARGATVRLATPWRGGVLSDTARTPALSSRYGRRTVLPQFAIALVGLLGLWFFASAAYQGYRSATRHNPAVVQTAAGIQIPSLVGQPLSAAQTAAVSSHFTLAVTSRQDETADPGVIVTQDPPAGTALAPGTVLNVVVSQGSGRVPDVRGLSPESAAQKLQAAGLRPGGTAYAHDDHVPSGMVVSQSANPGDRLAAKTPVNLVVSQGPSEASNPSGAPASYPGTAVVPNVTGLGLEQAESQLRAAGLRTGRVSYTYDDRVLAGVVLRQSQTAGAQASANDAVDLVISQGPRPAPAAPAPQAPAPANPPAQAPPSDQSAPPAAIP